MKSNIDETKKQDEYLKSNILNMILFANKRNSPQFSTFLDERQQAMILSLLKHEKFENYLFWGGNENCERKMLGIFTDENINSDVFPIEAIKLDFPKNAEISHRDCLGSLMGLQIKREMVGDIFADVKEAVLFVANDIFQFLFQSLEKVGKYNVTPQKIDPKLINKVQEIKELSGSISSLRLDCVVAFLCNKSRTISTEIIEKGLVKLNHIEVNSVSKVVCPNDILAIRGQGKFIITDDIKKTKKDRFFIKVNQLI